MSKKTYISFIIIIALLFSLSVVTTADSPINTEEMVLPTDLNPYEYGTAPDGLYVFLYHGTAPYLSININTSECEIDRLYVYDSSTDTVTEISDEAVSAYTATKDALYYITQAQVLYKTDYIGQIYEQLYVCSQGTITRLSSYLNILYFIKNNSEVIYLDTVSRQSQTVLQLDSLDWVYLLSKTELIAATEEGYFLYNFLTKETTAISEIDATGRINSAVLRWNNVDEPDVSVMAEFANSTLTHANDVSFPLSAYPANISNTLINFQHIRPISWFHINGQEGCSSSNCKSYSGTNECEGFARYAHDAYMHTVDNNIGYSAWLNEKHPVYNHRFDGSTKKVIDFFSSLNTGAYVRYETSSYYHSIVFVSKDTSGVWVYECNQSYYQNLTNEQIGNHPESYFGCGVHFQYYTYSKIATQYPAVAHYVNHTFAATPTCENAFMHRPICTSCDGYVRESHNMSGATYALYSSTQHKISFTCCSGVAYQPHSYSNNRCTKCGRYNDLIQTGF